MKRRCILACMWWWVPVCMAAQAQAQAQTEPSPVRVTVDVSAAPDLEAWADDAVALIEAWTPRLVNLLTPTGDAGPAEVALVFVEQDEGVGWTAGTRITIVAGWVRRHPDDLGLVLHELVHAVQRYPGGRPGWVVEGIADYLRWAVYEGKPADWFPMGDATHPRPWEQSYRVTAGFLLWLERGEGAGVVRRLDAACRAGDDPVPVFEAVTGRALPDLWSAYAASRGG